MSLLAIKELTTLLQTEKKTIPIVDKVSFTLDKGRTLCIVRESGSGKSMTALSIMRILPSPPMLPPQGEILFHDQNLLSLSEKKMRSIRGGKIAMIFQDPSSALNPVYTIGNQLIESCELHRNLFGKEAFDCSVQALEEVGIENAKTRFWDYPHQFSGGMRQRVMIAMALIGQPEILIADEPTTALDVTIQNQVLQLLKKLQKSHQMAILLITHDLGVVAEMASDVLVMYAGQIIERGEVHALFKSPKHPYTQGLFASRPIMTKERTSLKPIQGRVPSASNWPEGCRFHTRCPHVMDICKTGAVPNFHPALRQSANCWLYREGVDD